MLKVNIKKLSEDAKIPKYAKDGDAGLDLHATSISFEQHYIEYGTSLAIEIPYGYVGLLFPRSSVSKRDLVLANSVGVIDSGYRGEIKLRFKLTMLEECLIYKQGDRIGQLVIMPYPQVELNEVEELSETARGDGGFGSTDTFLKSKK